AAPIAASEAGIPFVHHTFGRAIPEAALRTAAEAVAPLWQAAGLEPDPLAGALRGSFVDICPPSLPSPLPDRPAQTYVRQAVDAVLTNQSYSAAARSVAAEISAMPTATAVADEIADTLARKPL